MLWVTNQDESIFLIWYQHFAVCLVACAGKERVLWVTNQDDTTGSARTFGGDQKLTLVLTAEQVLTWLVDLAAVPSKRTGESLERPGGGLQAFIGKGELG